MTEPTTTQTDETTATRVVLAEDSVLLRDGIVRTPMDPTATFTDDPLRILRCVRFGSRFGYAIHPDIFAALAAKGGKPDQLMIDATHLKAHRTAASLLKKGMFPDVSDAPRAA